MLTQDEKADIKIEGQNDNRLVSQIEIGEKVSKRFCISKQWFRVTVVRLPEPNSIYFKTENRKSNVTRKIIRDRKNMEEQLLYQYNFQSSLNREYVIKNIDFTITFFMATLIQQDYIPLIDFHISSLNLTQRLKIFLSVAEGIQDLQKNNICHRSISRSSICIVRQNGQYIGKINNFSTAAVILKKNEEIQSFPIPIQDIKSEEMLFASPEILSAKRHGFMTDIFSLGMILNYLLYETIKNIYQNGQVIKIKLPSKTPKWINQLLSSMLAYHPKQRPSIKTIYEIIKNSLTYLEKLQQLIPYGQHLKLQ